MNRAVLLQDLADQRLDRFFITNIAGLPAGATAVLTDLRRHRLQFFRLAPHQDHMGAEGCQLVGGATANATAAAGRL
eukprot:gene9016-10572_t